MNLGRVWSGSESGARMEKGNNGGNNEEMFGNKGAQGGQISVTRRREADLFVGFTEL